MKSIFKVVFVLAIIGTMVFCNTLSYAGHEGGGGSGYGKCGGREGQGHGKKGGHGPDVFGPMLEEIDLTDEQEAQIEEQKEVQKEKSKELWQKIKAKHDELRTELEKPESNKEAIDKTVSELNALNAEKMENRVNGILAIKGILTPEQFETLSAKKEEKKQSKRQKMIDKLQKLLAEEEEGTTEE